MTVESILYTALAFFLVTNPIGNTPAILALVKDYTFQRQRVIIAREVFFALLIALFFQFFGDAFLSILNLETYTITLCGGLLLFIVALRMIFATPASETSTVIKQEPFIVPIATPILSGPGLMATIMLFARKEQNMALITISILITWAGIFAVLVAGPYLNKLLGKRGMIALEQMMGMILGIMSMGLIVKGFAMYLNNLQL